LYTFGMKKSLTEMQKEIVSVFKEYEKTGTHKWTAEIASKDLAYQLGSLTKRMMQLKGERYADGLNKKELKKFVADELADILAEVLFISHELDIDMQEAWGAMVGSDKKKINTRSKKR
jgi:NTP pyrophosphatase (non-canonical NTP hydrolase)